MRGERTGAVLAGIFVLFSAAVAVGVTVVLARRSTIFTKRYTLRAAFTNVQGLREGATVRIAGVTVGSVKAIELAPPGARGKVVVYLSLEERCKYTVRSDSLAEVRTTGMLGDKYVEVTVGDPEAPPLMPGDVIKSVEPLDVYAAVEEARQALRKVSDIAAGVEQVLQEFRQTKTLANLDTATRSLANIIQGIEQGPGALHALVFDPEFAKLADDVKVSMSRLRSLIEQAAAEEGGTARVLLGEDYRRITGTLHASAESLHRLIQQVETGRGLLHTLVYGEEEARLLENLSQAAGRLNEVLRQVEEKEGTLGLLVGDPEVWEDLRRLLGGIERSRTLRLLIAATMEKAPASPAQSAPTQAPVAAEGLAGDD